ncbi:hypothetical protein [Sporomusa aerivorans]|uniref:hypothetical protein n=1 Tax=Sporomusa aerivorans TaxID=204936 RepID=UPI00352A5936
MSRYFAQNPPITQISTIRRQVLERQFAYQTCNGFAKWEASLQKIAPLIEQHGIMIVEDPGHTPGLISARVALVQFLRNNNNFNPVFMESGQTLLIRI